MLKLSEEKVKQLEEEYHPKETTGGSFHGAIERYVHAEIAVLLFKLRTECVETK